MSSRAWLLDLIHKVGEELALCDHLAEKLDDENCRSLYCATLAQRRKDMLYIVNSVEDANLEYWCEFKHAIKAYTLAVEVYDAQRNEESLAQVKSSADILAGVVSLFLGLEFKKCARCLNDRLSANYNEDINEEKSNA